MSVSVIHDSPGLSMERREWWAWFALLCLQNVAIFSATYAGHASPPWDFSATYHAVPFYWMASLRAGVFPEWVPFQALGYPIEMNLQSGLFYPPLLLFAATGLSYTLRAAAIVQDLHVLLGAFGCYAMLRQARVDARPAFFAAFAFQFFGGFYSNASHPDIVRGFALMPWILAGLLAAIRRGPFDRFALLVTPLSTLALATGGYPGQLIATMFVAPFFALACAFSDGQPRRGAILRTAGALILMALGLGMALVHLLPALVLRSELSRYVHDVKNVEGAALVPMNIFSLIQGVLGRYAASNATMQALYVGVPVVTLLALWTFRDRRQSAPWLALGVIASLLAFTLPVRPWLALVFSPLGFSRFPAADYRGFIGLALIALAAIVLARVLGDRAARPGGFRVLILAMFIIASSYVVATPAAQLFNVIVPIFCAGLILVALAFREEDRRKGVGELGVVLILVALSAGDAMRVIGIETLYWRAPDQDATYLAANSVDLGAPPVELQRRIAEGLDRRPARDGIGILNAKDYFHTWKGYVTGRYAIWDYSAGLRLWRRNDFLQRPALHQFALMPQSVLVFPNAHEVKLGDIADSARGYVFPGSVEPVRYRPDSVEYRVRLENPALVVENEGYFPGWTANIAGHAETMESIDVYGLRGWQLPAGDYTFNAKFRMPQLRLAALLSGGFLMLWLTLLFSVRRMRRRTAAHDSA
jgi:hypothetical protein